MIVSVIVNDPPFYLNVLPLIIAGFVAIFVLGIRSIVKMFKDRKKRREAQK